MPASGNRSAAQRPLAFSPEQVLRQLAYPKDRGKWYHAKTNDVSEALKGILEIIMNTVVNSRVDRPP